MPRRLDRSDSAPVVHRAGSHRAAAKNVLEIGRDPLVATFAFGNEQRPLGRPRRRRVATRGPHSAAGRRAPWQRPWPGPDASAAPDERIDVRRCERILGKVRGTRTNGTVRSSGRRAGGWRAPGGPGSTAPVVSARAIKYAVEARHRRQSACDGPGRQSRLAVGHADHQCDRLADGPRSRRRRPPPPRPDLCRSPLKNVLRSKATARRLLGRRRPATNSR